MSAAKREVIHENGKTRFVGHDRMTLTEYHAAMEAAWGADQGEWRATCPSCGTSTSLNDLFAAEPKAITAADKKERARYFAYSCIGRLTGATGAFDRKKFAPCNYTSGGLFCINTLVIVLPDGDEVPAFVPTPAPEATR